MADETIVRITAFLAVTPQATAVRLGPARQTEPSGADRPRSSRLDHPTYDDQGATHEH
jgi:hypothetical protein